MYISKPCIARPTLINLNLEKLHYCLILVSLDRCNGIYNTLNDLSSGMCFWNKTEDINLNVFNTITEIMVEMQLQSKME